MFTNNFKAWTTKGKSKLKTFKIKHKGRYVLIMRKQHKKKMK